MKYYYHADTDSWSTVPEKYETSLIIGDTQSATIIDISEIPDDIRQTDYDFFDADDGYAIVWIDRERHWALEEFCNQIGPGKFTGTGKNHPFKSWQAYMTDSFYSGHLINIDPDGYTCQIADFCM